MAYENLCMYCFEENGGAPVCPHCGRDARAAVPQIQLLPGTELYNGRFVVGRAMGQDANGIVYMAYDTKRATTLRIREYLPRESAKRLNDGSVVPAAGAEDAFDAGLKKLRASVESVEDPKKRHFFFAENGTGYIAQRKNAAAAAADDDAPAGRTGKQLALIVGVAAVVVLAVAFVVIRLISSAFDDPTVAPTPTLASGALWVPDETPTPTPYASATYAAIKDPELSWMDYTYEGNVENDYNDLNDSVATKTPTGTATPRPTNQTVNGNSSKETITDLQLQLVQLGWLSSNKVSGKYDSATKQAVKDFQNYMNNTYAIDPKLTVDGIAGAKTLYWLDQSEVSRKPTPTPTLPVKVTPKPDENNVINENSSRTEIKYVQQQLITLGILSKGDDDGVYGSTTRGGVWEFQERINKILGQSVLSVTGEVDTLTLKYLEYYAEWWENLNKNTPSPSPTVTATPTLEPTEDPDEDDVVVDGGSPAESIKYVQQQLKSLGLLDKVDGVYGTSTISAVKAFQTQVNKIAGSTVLEVSGVCNSQTLQYLEYYADLYGQTESPTVTATATVTPSPTATVTVTPSPTATATLEPRPDETDSEAGDDEILVSPESDAQSIAYLQEQLKALGLLDTVDGVYGTSTINAVKTFQERVNQVQGSDVLQVTGLCDVRTANYLEYYVDQAAQQPTPSPTPTAAPTETAPPVADISDPSIVFTNVASTDEGVSLLSGDTVISWYADGDVKAYHVEITDHLGNQYVNQTVTDTSINIPVANLTQGVVYLVEVGAVPKNGTEDDMKITSAYFALEPETVTEAPTEAPTETPPSIGAVSQPEISIGATAHSDNGVSYVSGDTTLSWAAQGDLAKYYVVITDSNGNTIIDSETTQTSLNVSAESMDPSVVYTLSVSAIPTNGTLADAVTTTTRFALEVAQTPAPTEAPTQAPTEAPTEAPTVGNISAPQLSVSGASYTEGGVSYVAGDSTLNWYVEGAVEKYRVRISASNGSTIIDDYTTNTFFDIPASYLSPGVVYTLDVAAIPVNGTTDDAKISSIQFALEPAAEPTDTPTPDPTQPAMPETIDSTSDPNAILSMQVKLLSLGYLYQDENPTQGVFDQATRNAVLRFQQNYNALNEAQLPEIDPADESAVVDSLTLSQIMK